MADDDEDEETVAVELGDATPVEGAPAARVASRLTWPQEASSVAAKEGEATVRTPDGPRTLESILEAGDVTYFESRQEFLETVRDVVGRGPVQTAEE
jgi:hypothetical protein